MSWNYRVFRRDAPQGGERISVHEVFYVDGEISLVTDTPVSLISTNSAFSEESGQMELVDDIQLILQAFKKTTLEYKEWVDE
jgi:hypothetical protein